MSAPLRFLTCGSVDNGKSTLIGRLLHETGQILDDQLAALKADSRRHGTVGDDIDFALLLDGLEAEREQGITIDVAYRYFSTARRAFIVADTPGHEEYPRNMATGASGCDLALILIDARHGILPQSKRHATICGLMGIKRIVLAVNKIDLVDFNAAAFERIVADFQAFSAPFKFVDVTAIPLSARFGDNVTARSPRMPWYAGPSLIDYLETVEVETDWTAKPFRFPVQWANRPNGEFRGFTGTAVSGQIKVGEQIRIAGSGRTSTVTAIIGPDGDVPTASAGEAVTLVLDDNIDVARGDMITLANDPPTVADQFAAHVVWMADEPLLAGRSFLMRIGTRWVPATVTAIKYKLSIETHEHLAARDLALNDVGFCNIATATPVAFDPYEDNRRTGSFILVDRYSNATVAAGLIAFALRRASNVHLESLALDKNARAAQKSQKPAVIWFTGLSGSGKSTVARALEARLHALGRHTMMLDGDNLRHGLNRDLGFTEADRVENIRRAGETAKLLTESGLIVICAFISPFRAERDLVRALFAQGEFFEVFVDTPLEECIKRDPKGLYAKARSGLIPNFTGIGSPYERPDKPELVVTTVGQSVDSLVERIVAVCQPV